MKTFACGLVMVLAAFLPSCTKEEFGDRTQLAEQSGQIVPSNRLPSAESRKVLLLYMASFNNLSNYIQANLDTLEANYLPALNRNDDVVLVFEKFPHPDKGYSRDASPVLYRLYADVNGKPTRDTLKIYPAGTIAASAKTMKETLEYVHSNFPAASYGLLFSSHASGWLPPGYYNSVEAEEQEIASLVQSLGAGPSDALESLPLHYQPFEMDPSLPAVKSGPAPLTKSIGNETIGNNSSRVYYEMTVQNFAKAIPMKLDYVIMDVCLTGGIELAYELKGKVGHLIASQTEVLADGIQYNTLLEKLFLEKQPDLTGICKDYYECYANKADDMERSATISLVDCSRLDRLQQVCASLFEKYRSALPLIDGNQVQRFFRFNKHWFFDLRDIIVAAGATKEELAELDQALAECIEYEAHTEHFLHSFQIRTSCGLSMFLPRYGTDQLKAFYQTLRWNQATSLVK